MKAETRVLRFLRQGGATLAAAARPDHVLLDGGARGAVAVPIAAVRRLLSERAIAESGGAIRLAPPSDGKAARPQPEGRDIEPARVEDPSGALADVLVNHAESPLASLMRRKTRQGAPFLSRAEFEAGERLRADFGRGALMPRLGMNWSSPVASGRRGGGIGELTDAALAARLRVERALGAVGPELSGVLVDVCCFMKGLEQVEGERGWPVRSAKIVLKSALSALARYYDPRSARVGTEPRAILGWGAEDYKPRKA